MALVPWESRELTSLQSEMNRLFSSFFGPTAHGSRWMPATDIVESDGEYVLTADLPGMSEKDVKIEVENNVLTVSGERRSEHEDKRAGYHRLERSFGSFARSVNLPEGVNTDDIEASFENGVLSVHIPKPAQTKPQRVQVEAKAAKQT
jgi:HSP20 family protein